MNCFYRQIFDNQTGWNRRLVFNAEVPTTPANTEKVEAPVEQAPADQPTQETVDTVIAAKKTEVQTAIQQIQDAFKGNAKAEEIGNKLTAETTEQFAKLEGENKPAETKDAQTKASEILTKVQERLQFIEANKAKLTFDNYVKEFTGEATPTGIDSRLKDLWNDKMLTVLTVEQMQTMMDKKEADLTLSPDQKKAILGHAKTELLKGIPIEGKPGEFTELTPEQKKQVETMMGQVEKLIANPEAAKKMGLFETIATVMQMWKSLVEAFNSGDYTVLNEMMEDFNKGKNPLKEMKEAQGKFKEKLTDDALNGKSLADVMELYNNPRSAKADEILGAENAKYRHEVKPILKDYMTRQLGITISEIGKGPGGSDVIFGYNNQDKPVEIRLAPGTEGKINIQYFISETVKKTENGPDGKPVEKEETQRVAQFESDQTPGAVQNITELKNYLQTGKTTV